jgi:S-(hydroxymethyl)glutathione dehydrogenase / alcohol dehydrogenase
LTTAHHNFQEHVVTYRCRAAILHAPGQPLRLEEITLTQPGRGEVLVRTMAAGIRGTDLFFGEGRFPFPVPTVLGHEAAGIVEAIGDHVTGIATGDRVIVCDHAPCGRCAACLTGAMVYCSDTSAKQRQRRRLRLNGEPFRQYLGVSAYAELMLVDASALVPLASSLSFETGALLSCCMTTGLATVFNVSRPEPGSRVAIIGAGGIGLSAIQGARIAGASQIIAVDLEPHRLQIATELGATDTILTTGQDAAAEITALTSGGADRSIEAVGLQDTAAQAFRCLAPGGHATIIGMLPPNTDIPVPGRLIRQGRTLTGTVMGSVRSPADIPRYADMLLRGLLQSAPLITSSVPLKNINDALVKARSRKGARTLISF